MRRNSLTRFSVVLEGFASGRLVITHSSRVRIEFLSMSAKIYLFVTYDHSTEEIYWLTGVRFDPFRAHLYRDAFIREI